MRYTVEAFIRWATKHGMRMHSSLDEKKLKESGLGAGGKVGRTFTDEALYRVYQEIRRVVIRDMVSTPNREVQLVQPS